MTLKRKEPKNKIKDAKQLNKSRKHTGAEFRVTESIQRNKSENYWTPNKSKNVGLQSQEAESD